MAEPLNTICAALSHLAEFEDTCDNLTLSIKGDKALAGCELSNISYLA